MKWINVKDRLPEDDKLKVIKYGDRKTGQHIGIHLSHYYIPTNMNKKKWCFEFANTQSTKVTHWIPLPN